MVAFSDVLLGVGLSMCDGDRVHIQTDVIFNISRNGEQKAVKTSVLDANFPLNQSSETGAMNSAGFYDFAATTGTVLFQKSREIRLIVSQDISRHISTSWSLLSCPINPGWAIISYDYQPLY